MKLDPRFHSIAIILLFTLSATVWGNPKDKVDIDSGNGPPVINGLGGPDDFGYTWIDSDEPGGPVFDYIDISATGILVEGLSDDSFVGPFPIGFSFNFYGIDYTEFYISSNGFIGFGPTDGFHIYVNVSLPNPSSPNNIICWAWDDLHPRSGSVYYQTIGNDLIVQFVNYGEFGGSGEVDAQVILSANSNILLQYLSFRNGFDTQGSTSGIENVDGSDGLQVAFNTNYLHDLLAVKIASAPSINITANPNPTEVGDSLDILLDLVNPGEGFDAEFRLWVLADGNVMRLVSLSPFVDASFTLDDHPIFETLSVPAGLPPTVGFLAAIFDDSSGALLDSDFEALGIGVAPPEALVRALAQVAKAFLDGGWMLGAPPGHGVYLFNGTVSNPFGPVSAKEKLTLRVGSPSPEAIDKRRASRTTTWAEVKSGR